jgi:hypothetical protein
MSLSHESRVTNLVHEIFVQFDITENKLAFEMRLKGTPKDDSQPHFSIEFINDLSILTIDELNGTWSDDLLTEIIILKNVDVLVSQIPECKTIQLRLSEDEVKIQRCGFMFNLVALEIFKTGESLYNHFGYKKPSYNSDKEENDKIRNMPLKDAIRLLDTKMVCKSSNRTGEMVKFTKKYPYFDDNFTKIITKIVITPSAAIQITVADFVRRVFELIEKFPKTTHDCDPKTTDTARQAVYVIKAFGELLTFPDSGTVFIKDMQFEQFEQQISVIRRAVQTVFKDFIIKEFGDKHDYSYIKYKISDKTTNRDCLILKFTKHDFIERHLIERHLIERGLVEQDESPPHDPKYEGFTVLHIGSLSKCGANSGTALLAFVDELAQSIPFIEYKTLTDASQLKKCNKDVALAHLTILANDTAESWYGSNGYKSPKHGSVIAHNKKLQNINLFTLLDALVEDTPDYNVKSQIIDAYPESTPQMTVKDFFIMVKRKIHSFPEENCTDEQNKQIEALNKLKYGMIKISNKQYKFNYYDYKHLFKPVIRTGGYKRGTKKRGTKKRGTKNRGTKKRGTKKR